MTVPQVDLASTVQTAAEAAARLIPAQQPLAAQPGAVDALPTDACVFVATFTGQQSGEAMVALEATVAQALSAAPGGISLVDALQPALQAVADVTGPTVLGPVRQMPTESVSIGEEGMQVVALTSEEGPGAWVGISLQEQPGQTVPKPRAEEDPETTATEPDLDIPGLHLISGVEMTLSVEIGRARMTVYDLLSLAPGSMVELDRSAGAPADLLVNGRLVARGEVVVVDEDYGLRITELLGPTPEAR